MRSPSGGAIRVDSDESDRADDANRTIQRHDFATLLIDNVRADRNGSDRHASPFINNAHREAQQRITTPNTSSVPLACVFWNHAATPFSSFIISITCLLYTSDAADERSSVDLGGRR